MTHQPDMDFRPRRVDDDIANAARTYDYLLGGQLNTQADRELADRVERQMPGARECARSNRGFAARAVRHAARRGVTQFLDLGAGMPTAGGLHQIALEVNPAISWVGVDNEGVAVSAGDLATEKDDRVAYTYADVTNPAQVLGNDAVREMIDFRKKVAILAFAVLHFVPESKTPYRVVRAYRDATVPGSVLALSHATLDDPSVPQMNEAIAHYDSTRNGVTARSRGQVRLFTDGYDVVEPGVTLTADWCPDGLRNTEQRPKSGAWAFVGIRR